MSAVQDAFLMGVQAGAAILGILAVTIAAAVVVYAVAVVAAIVTDWGQTR